MKKDQEIPIVEQIPVNRYHQHTCNGCGEQEGIQTFTFRTGWNAAMTLTWCRECRTKIAAYLISVEERRCMETKEIIGAVILALDLYRIALAKQYAEPDSSEYGSLIERGSLLVEGLHDVMERFREEGKELCI